MGLNNYMGYVGLPPAWSLDPNAAVTKRVAGVRWEKAPLSSPTWTVHEDALPRARLATHAVVSDAPREAIAELDVATTAIVDTPVSLDGGEPGTLAWRTNEPGNTAWEVDGEATQLLVFAERYHPGWRFSVDGAPVDLVRVYGDFMGAVVPAGKHTVAATFRPDSVRYGLGLSVAGVLLTLIGGVVLGTSSMSSLPLNTTFFANNPTRYRRV